MSIKKALIVDDNIDFSSTMAEIVGSLGYLTQMISNPTEAMNYIQKNNTKIDIILLDIEFGPGVILTGLDILEFSRKKYPAIPVIMISGKGTIETAVRATKLGAINFIEKSIISKEKIKNVLESSVEKHSAGNEEREILNFLEMNGIIGKSKEILQVGESIIRYGRTDLNILITGETGTGKRLVANAIHAISRRSKSPLVTVDIPNIPKELFQSELFGHIKGSFTGANDTKKGLFQQANKGSLFLDEIGDMTVELQSNLLIPIEEKIVRKIGSIESEPIDVRFISATDKDLIHAMREGRFKEPLYHRLRECEINIPPLRSRAEDIEHLVQYYTTIHNKQYEEGKLFSQNAISFLSEQIWQGNVRELSSVIKVALQTSRDDSIDVNQLHKIMQSNTQNPIIDGKSEDFISSDKTLKQDLAQVDKKKIESTLERTNGNVSKSAATLGVSRETLHNKIRKYGINVQDFRAR